MGNLRVMFVAFGGQDANREGILLNDLNLERYTANHERILAIDLDDISTKNPLILLRILVNLKDLGALLQLSSEQDLIPNSIDFLLVPLGVNFVLL